jgi:RNA polymerase sigma factor (sigma-70 family)
MGRPNLRLVASRSEATPPSTPPLDDARLLAAIRTGDEAAAAELHERLAPRVGRTIAALLGSGHPEREDLSQESFVQIVLSLDRWRGECSLETWAATIAARTVFKFLRRRTVERRAFQDAGDEPPERVGPSGTRQLVARDLATRIREHLAALDEAKAEAFLLHDVCGFDAREVAAIAGIGEAAAHGRIARGRRELHARLADDPELRDALEDWGLEP